MKNLIIKWLYLNYDARLFGKVYSGIPRAAIVVLPIMMLAILISPYFWILFTACVLLTFPLIKNTAINIGSLLVVIFVAISSIWGQHSWWEGLPFLYGAIGIVLNNTLFLMPLKYKDITEWEQKRQYLLNPSMTTSNDNTLPMIKERNGILKVLNERFNTVYRDTEKKFVNAWRYIIPWGILLLLVIIFLIIGESNPIFPEMRGF